MIPLLLVLACGSSKPADTSETATTPSGSPGTSTTTAPFTSSWTTTTSTTTPPGVTTPQGGTPGGGPTTTDTALWDACDWARAVPGWLDALQTPDGTVLYCHSSGGVDWTFVISDVPSCLTHLSHASDIFPSWGC